jgi:hypothetical protein
MTQIGKRRRTPRVQTQQSGGSKPHTVYVKDEEKEPDKNLFLHGKITRDNALILAIRSTDFLNKACHLLDHEYFEGDIAKGLIKSIFSYYAKYQKAPSNNITEWIDKQAANNKIKKDYVNHIHTYVKNLLELETPDPRATIDFLQDTVHTKVMMDHTTEALSLLKAGRKDQARRLYVDMFDKTDPRVYDDFTDEKPQLHTPFPHHVIAGVAGEFADLYSKYLESPREFFYMSFLTCLGSVLADKVQVVTELDAQPRLYTLLLGESARTRKSTAAKKAYQFFKETLEQDEFYIIHGTGSGEGVARVLNEKNPLLVYYDEFKSMVDKSSYKGSSLLSLVTVLFDNNTWDNKLKKEKDSVDVVDGYLSILGCSTVETYEKLFTTQFIDIGFTNRVFLVPGEGKRKNAIPRKIPDEEKEPIKRNLLKIIDRAAAGIYLPIQPEAFARYHRWYHEETDTDTPYGRRIDTYGTRLMSLLTVNEHKDQVDLAIVEKVVALMEWQFQMRQIYEPINVENKYAELEEKIRRKLHANPKGITEGILKNRVRADNYGIRMWDYALSNLRAAGEIQIIHQGKTRLIIPLKLKKEDD